MSRTISGTGQHTAASKKTYRVKRPQLSKQITKIISNGEKGYSKKNVGKNNMAEHEGRREP